ncbi:UNVERIFIED_CONTAM: hypothetical protein FKN15_008580 [Acipenser sinensis]
MAVPERNVPAIMPALPSSSSLASQVHAAAVNGDRTALNKLIAGTPVLRDAEDQFGRTPLMYCVLADRLDCAESLLKAGANVNKADHSQRTALHLAAQKVWWLRCGSIVQKIMDWQEHVSADMCFSLRFLSCQRVAALNRDKNNNWAFQIGEKTWVKTIGDD